MTDLVDMERARMKVTRVCIYHVDHEAAGKSHAITGEIFAHMLCECICHQVTIVGGDANRLSYQKANKQLNSSYSMSTCQFWTERMEQTMDHYFKKVLENNKDFNVRQFHSISYLDLKCLRDTIGGQVDLHPDVRKETDRIGDCCLLTFFEYGLSTPVETFIDGNNIAGLEYKYSVNELLFYLTNDILLLREKMPMHIAQFWSRSNPLLCRTKRRRPSTLMSRRNRGQLTGRNFKRQTKLKEKPVLQTEVYFSPEKITSSCLG